MNQDINCHDRLDKLMHTEEYVEAKCGSLNARGEQVFCHHSCPTLRAQIKNEPAEAKER